MAFPTVSWRHTELLVAGFVALGPGAWGRPSVFAVLPSVAQRPWIVETNPDNAAGRKADFIIATERWRCAENRSVVLIDDVKRFDRTFAWIYSRRSDN
jgi:hypothetical protein